MSNSRRASSPITKKKNVISPVFTQYWSVLRDRVAADRIESVVFQTRS